MCNGVLCLHLNCLRWLAPLAVKQRIGSGDAGCSRRTRITCYFGERIDGEGFGGVELAGEVCDRPDDVDGGGMVVVNADDGVAALVDVEYIHGDVTRDASDGGGGEGQFAVSDERFHVYDFIWMFHRRIIACYIMHGNALFALAA